MGTIKVKPLEWDELTAPREDGPPEPIGDFEADTIVGVGSVYRIPDGTYSAWLGDDFVGRFDSDEDGKAAVQSAYSLRVLRAIEAAE